MFSTLRSRLWISYALVTVAALIVVIMVLLFFIIQNPSTYRQASARLTVVGALLLKNETELANLSTADLQIQIEQMDEVYSTRIILFNAKRQVIIDSQSALQPALSLPRLPRLLPYSILRDQNGKYWLYILSHLSDGRWIMLAVPRPTVPIFAILSDELILPVLMAGGIALIISLLVAFWLSRWIGDPLQKVVSASQQMPSTQTKPIMPGGPHEIQELTRAFNEMNTRVQASQKSQREFIANVSHELKTPLTSIQGFAQALLDNTANTPKEQKKAAQVIYDESGRMHRMVLDLLDLARMDAGTLDLQRVPVNLAALLNSVAERFTPQAHLAKVDIRVETFALPVITGDVDRLTQVFTDLVDNALKFTPSGGSITIRAEQVPSGVQVAVMDTGAGISPEDLPHIFDRFYQADLSRSGGRKHGAGLGLAIVKEIVGAHRGKISVRSDSGKGSTFLITLPLTILETSTANPKRKT